MKIFERVRRSRQINSTYYENNQDNAESRATSDVDDEQKNVGAADSNEDGNESTDSQDADAQDRIRRIPVRTRILNYQRTGNTIIRPLLFKTEICAFDLARAYYEEYRNHPDPAKRLNFEDDLLDYMRTGFVCVRPKLFAMVKVVDHEGERMWFIRIAVGDLCELISVLPFYLERMCFCRDNRADSMRIVSTKRLAQVAFRMAQSRIKLKEAA